MKKEYKFNPILLKFHMRKYGIKSEDLAKQLNIHVNTFYKKLKSGNFTRDEIEIITIALNLNDEDFMNIFFDQYPF